MRGLTVVAFGILSFGLLFGVRPAYAQSTASSTCTQRATSPAWSPCTAGVLDNIQKGFEEQTSKWADAIENVATRLFLDFGIIALVWMAIGQIFQPTDWGRFFPELMKFIFVTGLFFAFLKDGPYFATMIMQGFAKLAGLAVDNAVPVGDTYGASALVSTAGNMWMLVEAVASNFSIMTDQLGTFLLTILIGVAGSLLCVLMAIEVMLAWIQAYAVMYAGVFFLGFGGGPWLRDMAIGYWKTILSKGAFLFGVILSAGLFLQFSNATLQQIEALARKTAASGFFSLHSVTDRLQFEAVLMQFVLQALLCFLVLMRLPRMLAQLPFGGGSFQGHGTHGGMGMAAGAIVGGATGGFAGAVSGAARGLRGALSGLSSQSGGSGSGGGSSGGSGGDSPRGGGGFKLAASPAGGGSSGPMIPDEVVNAASTPPKTAPSSSGSPTGGSRPGRSPHTLMSKP
jgi:type IV secretion system protein TrbL